MTCTDSQAAPRAGFTSFMPRRPFRAALRWVLAILRMPGPGPTVTVLPDLSDRQRRDLGLPERSPERLPDDLADRLRILHGRF